MILYINTLDRKNTYVSLIENKKEIVREKLNSDSTPDSALKLVKRALSEAKKNISDIHEINVEKGPGSFTGARVGVTIANSLSLALNVPINNNHNSYIEEPIYK